MLRLARHNPNRRIETWPSQRVPAHEFSGPLYMDAVLAPNRSLSNPGFVALMSVLVAASFAAGVLFVSVGAWPVFGFFGLDVLLVWLAFRLSYRSGRLREQVRVAAETAEIVRVHPAGHVQRWRAAPQLSRVEVDAPMTHDGQVRLVSSGRVLVLGAFLSPPEREDFGKRLAAAFDSARAERAPAF